MVEAGADVRKGLSNFSGNRVRLMSRVAGTLLVGLALSGCGNEGNADLKFSPTATAGYVPDVMATAVPFVQPAPASIIELPPTIIDPGQCQPEDPQVLEEYYVGEALGVKKRLLPEMDAPFDSAAAQNTRLNIECAREIDGRVWLRIAGGNRSFWVPEDFTSKEPVVHPTPVSVRELPSQQVVPVKPQPTQTAEVILPPEEKIDPLTKIPFNWRRNEVLFGPGAGFDKARNGQSLTVWVNPGIGVSPKDIIGPWNNLAGWDLFVPSSTENADINFVIGSSTFVKPNPDYTQNYSDCTVFTNPKDINLKLELQHEIGHCLGIVDFLAASSPTAGYVNPQKCDVPGKFYLGVMSYCTWLDTAVMFLAHDKLLLALAGYIH